MSELLQDLVVVFLLAVVVVLVLRRIHVPPIAGFILAGVLAGPHVLNIIKDIHQVEKLAEIGVALLLFGIGLELSLDRMRRLWRIIAFGGMLQVGVTVLSVAGLGQFFGLTLRTSIFIGCVIAVSSTAIVLRALRTRGELEAPHGRLTLGVLVFQDLCVVPMILIIPLLAGTGGDETSILFALLKSIALIVGVLVAARLVVPRLLHLVAQSRQRDLFVLSVFLVCIGTAWIVSLAGVSIALGAFLGGLVVAGSDYRHQALSDLIPFREVFASLFFVSIGMLFDPRILTGDAFPIMSLVGAIVLGKFLIVLMTGLVLHLPLRPSIMAGASLAQAGEFSFVLLNSGKSHGMLTESLAGNLTAAIVLSMLITPIVLAMGPRLAAGVDRVSVITKLLRVRTPRDIAAYAAELKDHVIIAGLGLTGQELAGSLKACGIPYIIVDMNAETVRRASETGEPVCFGDVTSPDVLGHLGLARARELVLVINDPSAAERALRVARRLDSRVPVFVRAQFLADVEGLLRAGATDVIIAELEASAAVTQRLLGAHGVTGSELDPLLQRIRERHSEETT